MKQFSVIVYQQRVVVKELARELKRHDVAARVDGDNYRYVIRKEKGEELEKGWRDRGYSQAYYHALNAGNLVTFDPVFSASKTRAKQRHALQSKLF